MNKETPQNIAWVSIAIVAIGVYFTFGTDDDVPAPVHAVTAWSTAMTDLDAAVMHHQRRAAAEPTSWLDLERIALVHLGRAHLSGDYAEYEKAEAALESAFQRAPEGSGPFLTRARLAFTLHRLDDVEADLAAAERAILMKKSQRLAIDELRASVAFQRGDYATAKARLEAVLEERTTATALARLAQIYWKTGDFERAEALYLDAITQTPPTNVERHAWLELMRGLLDLDRERLDDALAHYRAADSMFDGWYLIEEHIAEIHALKGAHETAREQYEDLVDRTNSPEFMDALAETYAALDRNDDAIAMRNRARQRYEAQLARFPEAAYGHALDHYLETKDASRAVDLAEKNAAIRPNPEALEKLASAYELAGRDGDAASIRSRIER